jgi:hypothetical protein
MRFFLEVFGLFGAVMAFSAMSLNHRAFPMRLQDSLTKSVNFCYSCAIGDVLASTLVVKLFDACRERIISRKSILHFNSRKRRNLRTRSLRAENRRY